MMNLLLDEDYEILKEAGLQYEEDANLGFLVLKNFPLPAGFYSFNGTVLETVEVLYMIPTNYNMSGGDMFWTHPFLTRVDGKAIPAMMQFGGGDARHFKSKEFCRWSRHFGPDSWKPKVDNVEKILARIEWALKNPDGKS